MKTQTTLETKEIVQVEDQKPDDNHIQPPGAQVPQPIAPVPVDVDKRAPVVVTISKSIFANPAQNVKSPAKSSAGK